MINVKILADSKYKDNRVITFELEYPRQIHSELLTHRVYARNAASSRNSFMPNMSLMNSSFTDPNSTGGNGT